MIVNTNIWMICTYHNEDKISSTPKLQKQETSSFYWTRSSLDWKLKNKTEFIILFYKETCRWEVHINVFSLMEAKKKYRHLTANCLFFFQCYECSTKRKLLLVQTYIIFMYIYNGFLSVFLGQRGNGLSVGGTIINLLWRLKFI